MRKPHLPIIAVGAILAMAPLHALAQQVEFTRVAGVAVPTLAPYGLILLALLVAGAAFWLTRKRALATRVLTIAALASGTAYLASHTELIAQAWAGADAIPLSATQSPVPLTPLADGNRYEIQNHTGGAIVITALVDGGNCGGPGGFYDVYPLDNYLPDVPACNPQTIVQPNKSCVVEITCDLSGV